jgi:molecular chaperone HtpG
MIHSLYSNKEIFLRELISNASDAADKLRFEALTDPALFETDRTADPRERRQGGAHHHRLGQRHRHVAQEVVDNIGTIARPARASSSSRLTGDQAKDAQLIGQFGVGFYSSFIVADRVTLVTRRAGLGAEHGVRWESTTAKANTRSRPAEKAAGTDVTLHLREGEDELLEGAAARSCASTPTTSPCRS